MADWAMWAAAGIAILAPSQAMSAADLISGKYVLDHEHSDDDIDSIRSAVPRPTNSNWPEMRRALIKSSLATEELRISIIADRFSVKDYSVKPLVDVRIGGDPVTWKVNDGQVFEVSAKGDGQAVTLTFRGKDDEKTIVFRGVGQQLVVLTTITSLGLSAPIRYNIVLNQAKP